MSFCRKCGQEINEGVQFCGNCGISAGEEKNLNSSSNEVRRPTNSNFSIYINEILEIAKSMLKKPVSTIVSCDEKLKKESCGILVLILSALFGLSNIWTIKMAISGVEKSVTKTGGIFGLDQIFAQASNFVNESIPYGKIFFTTGFIFLLGLILLFASNYLIGKYIFKSSVRPETILKVISCSAIPFILILFLRIVVSYISSMLGLIVLFIGIIATIIILFKGIAATLDISEEIVIFIIPISYLIMFWSEYMIISKMVKSFITNIF